MAACILQKGLARNFLPFIRFSSQQAASEEVTSNVIENSEGIVEVSINRPSAKNALNRSLVGALEHVIAEIKEDNSVRAVILKSAVHGVFCAGADLRERTKLTQDEVYEFVNRLRKVFDQFADLPMPTIAAIDGVALGGGLELALAADIRICTASSRLGLPETRLAIVPGAGGTQRLARLINPAVAKELIYTAQVITGAEAYKLGMVNHVVESDSLDKAKEIAVKIASNGPLAVRAAKLAIKQGISLPIEEGLRIEEQAYASIIPTKDRVEGLAAFNERRVPKYKGQ